MTDHEITAEQRRGVDGAALTEAIGIDESEIAWRKSFTGFDETDATRLAEMQGTFDRIADDLVSEFYDHLGSFSESQAVLDGSPLSLDQLAASQEGYLRDLGGGEYGQSYFDRRARIGKVHDVLDMPPKFYLGAYSIYYRGIVDAVADDVVSELAAGELGDNEPERSDGGVASTPETPTDQTIETVETALDVATDRIMSTLKLLLLDQQVTIDTYLHSYNERIETAAERRRELAATVTEEVAEPLEDLATEAESTVDTAETLSAAADDAVDGMETSADEIAELSATVEEVAATAEEVAATSEQSRELAATGQASAEDALETMEAIDTATETVESDLSRLVDQIEEVEDVVSVIDDIADQTNLLALNASIEAARAGAEGDGFGVVAEEVKRLAEESRSQAGRIEETIAAVRTDVAETVDSLDETSERVAAGVTAVESTLSDLDEIRAAAAETADGIEEVSRATDDQAASTEEVAATIEDATETVSTVADEARALAAANSHQRDRVRTVEAAVDRLETE